MLRTVSHEQCAAAARATCSAGAGTARARPAVGGRWSQATATGWATAMTTGRGGQGGGCLTASIVPTSSSTPAVRRIYRIMLGIYDRLGWGGVGRGGRRALASACTRGESAIAPRATSASAPRACVHRAGRPDEHSPPAAAPAPEAKRSAARSPSEPSAPSAAYAAASAASARSRRTAPVRTHGARRIVARTRRATRPVRRREDAPPRTSATWTLVPCTARPSAR